MWLSRAKRGTVWSAKAFMKGRRTESYDPMLGLAILRARTPDLARLGYDVRGLEIIAAFMGTSRSRAQQINERALRKVRIALRFRYKEFWKELRQVYE